MAEETVEQAPEQNTAGDWRAWLAKLRQPALPQLGLMVGVAAVLALLIALALWSSAPSYEVLYHGLADADAGEIMAVLQQSNIPFKVDSRTGALTVPANNVHAVRLKLASQGLPRGTVNGFDLLDQKNSFGVSQFMENARYQHALEGELARSITSIGAVQSARVHLALPKETVFVREQQLPSASVLVQLHPGRVLDKGQVAAIVHLISSSVPKLSADKIAVIDQTGALLTRPGGNPDLAQSMDQMDYTRQLEERYIRRIEDIVTPILGLGKVQAQVALDMDFTVTEETAEFYDPKQPQGMMRSERLLEESNARPQAAGIPGALSNQPPGTASAPEKINPQDPNTAGNPNAVGTQTDTNLTQRQRKEMTRNYEMDKRVSHLRKVPGEIKRISTAVVLDDRVTLGTDGKPAHNPLTAEELERITNLVKEAVGFNAARGDTVNVINATFAASPLTENPLPWWQQDWFLALVKWGVVGIVAVLLLLLVVRPVMHRMLAAPSPVPAAQVEKLNGPVAEGKVLKSDEEGLEGLLEDRVEIGSDQQVPQLGHSLEQLDKRLKTAKALVAEDPKRAVQVIKNWMASEV